MIKSDNKKVSKQFINYLKDTANVPSGKPQLQKQKPTKQEQPIKGHKYSGPVEGDFSNIGYTYVLENDKLTKKTLLYGRQNVPLKESQIFEQYSEGQNIETIKQIAKLKFLEKKGFLKPEQSQRLQKLQGRCSNPPIAVTEKKNLKDEMIQGPKGRYIQFANEKDAENMDPNFYYQEYASPKSKQCSMNYLPQQNFQLQDSYQPHYHQFGQPYYQNGSNYPSQGNHRPHNYY